MTETSEVQTDQSAVKPAVSHWLKATRDQEGLDQGERLEFCGWAPKEHSGHMMVFEVYAAGKKVVANMSTPDRGWETTMNEVTTRITAGDLIAIDPPHDN